MCCFPLAEIYQLVWRRNKSLWLVACHDYLQVSSFCLLYTCYFDTLVHSFCYASKNTPETNMAHTGIDHLRLTCCRPVPQTIIRRADMRTSFHHFSWNFYLRLIRIITGICRNYSWIDMCSATGLHFIGTLIQMRNIPVTCPFPYISRHII